MHNFKNNDEKFEYIDKLLKNNINKSEIMILLEIIKSETLTTTSLQLVGDLKSKAPDMDKFLKSMYDKNILDRYLDLDGRTYIYKINDKFKPV